MSWSVDRTGKAEIIRPILANDFARIKCQEPEQTVANKISEAIDAVLAVFPKNNFIVKVSASGSQYQPDSSKFPGEFHNQVSFKIEPIHISE